MKAVKDERIEKIENKYGAHAFIIISALLISSALFKSLILNLPFKEYLTETIIFLIGTGYYAIRIANAGLFHTVKESKIYIIISFAVTSVVFGVLIGLINMFRYQNGQFNGLTMVSMSILAVEAFILISAAWAVFEWLSKRGEQKQFNEN
ncbi:MULTISPECIES: DUF6773 family protein [Methanobacterium]|uniref:Uncharacterized protein n=1 Tax=Methanobacterium bryantii TaxID=2161 RepID=A0A2A2H793_METBR|nr:MULTISPECIES: DUF6773 family protein [Methanobacterium]OEC84963.1 hypothetical protein A9507_01125 [Methanobacterium sp. A39]PAV05113.1 hypothetical protein ASJ80_12545 [Methanobacterium bryantii]